MKKFEVATVGSALKDIMYYTSAGEIKSVSKSVESLTLEFDEKIKSNKVFFGYGGGAANSAVNFEGLGFQTTAIFSVGKDEEGENILGFFRLKGIDVSHTQKSSNNHTGFSFLLIHEQNKDHIVFSHYGAAADLSGLKKDYKKVKTEWWYVTSLNNENWEGTIKGIIAQKGSLAWNPGAMQLNAGYTTMRPFLKKTAVLLLNKQEATKLVMSNRQYATTKKSSFSGKQGGELLLSIIAGWGPEIVVITDGRQSIVAKHGSKTYYKIPPKDKPVDTTGAGDSFGSTFVAVWHRTNDVDRALEAAMINTTAVVHKVGAQSGFLTWGQLKSKASL